MKYLLPYVGEQKFLAAGGGDDDDDDDDTLHKGILEFIFYYIRLDLCEGISPQPPPTPTPTYDYHCAVTGDNYMGQMSGRRLPENKGSDNRKSDQIAS